MTGNIFKIKEVSQIYLSNKVYRFFFNANEFISTTITTVFKGKLNSTKTTY